MVDIPPELWLNIAQFIPEDVLYQLRCVNSVFLDLALGVRWRRISITARMTAQSIRLLDRLSDPVVARKVQNMSISLGNVDQTSKEGIWNCSHIDQIDVGGDGRLKKLRGDQAMRHFKNTYQQCFGSMVLEAIVRLSAGFLNLRNLTLDFPGISPSFNSHALRSFFDSLWATCENKLYCLSLSGGLLGYHTILQNPPILSSLKQLEIQIVNNPQDRVAGGLDTDALFDNLAHFINRQSQSLDALKIWSCPSRSQAVDLSRFFSQLSSFPSLSSLDVRLAFNKSFYDPSGLKYLIWNTSGTLKRLNLRLNPSGFAMPWDMEPQLCPWLSSCLANPQAFSRLKVLDIYPSREPENVFILMECIKRASANLEEIMIRDHYLQWDEAAAIINEASQCRKLVSLHLNVWEIDINLIDLLSKKLPRIENLSLSTVESQVEDFPASFIKCLRARSYAGWGLQDISLYYGNREIDAKVMCALAQSISSVQYVFGKKCNVMK